MMKKNVLAFAALVLVVAGAFVAVDAQTKIITVTNGVQASGAVWGPMERCFSPYKAVSYSTQNDFANVLPTADKTALNTIAIICNDIYNSNYTSTPGHEGTFGNAPTCQSPFNGPGNLAAFRLRVQPLDYSNSTIDNTAANDIQFVCDNLNQLAGAGNTEGDWGQYSDSCPLGICGIQTLVQPNVQGQDNTALNDVRFECCNY